MFRDHEMNITDEGRNYLGAPIGTREYIKDYCRSKITEWMDENEVLSEIAKSQPQAALTCTTDQRSHIQMVVPSKDS